MILTPGQLNRRAELYYQLGTMISSGVPLIQTLETATMNRSAGSMRKYMPMVLEHMREGCTLNDSLRKVPAWLPEFDMALIMAGEQSGRLDNSFKQLADFYSVRAKIIRDSIGRSLVTIATLHVFLLVFPIGLLQRLALGIMDQKYSECWPFIFEKIIVFGAIYTLIFIFIFSFQGNRGGTWRTILDSLLHIVPLLGNARRNLALSRLAAGLEALINAGVPIHKSWEYAAAASGSPRLVESVSHWGNELDRGATPADLVNRTPYFPQVFANMYTTGEMSGKLDETLLRLQAYHQEEGNRKMDTFTRVLTGILYGMVALLVAYNVIRFWVNYYNGLLSGI
ncbi:MAG TPA: type II secretion system F family protein [Verrucomicrobiae bacterium]